MHRRRHSISPCYRSLDTLKHNKDTIRNQNLILLRDKNHTCRYYYQIHNHHVNTKRYHLHNIPTLYSLNKYPHRVLPQHSISSSSIPSRSGIQRRFVSSPFEDSLQRAQDCLTHGNPVDALHHVNTALDMRPNDTSALTIRADILSQMGHHDDAVHHLRRALHASPHSISVRVSLSLALVRLAENRIPSEASDPSLAQEYITEAIQHANAVLFAEERYAPGHFALGNALLLSGDVDGARSSLIRGLELDPYPCHPRLLLGRIDLSSNNLDAALRWYQEVLDQKDNDVEALEGQAMIYQVQNQWKSALDILNRLLDPELCPTDPTKEARLHLQRARVLLGEKKVDQALEACQMAADKGGDAVTASERLLRAECLQAKKPPAYDTILRILEEALSVPTVSVDERVAILSNLGHIYGEVYGSPRSTPQYEYMERGWEIAKMLERDGFQGMALELKSHLEFIEKNTKK